jgi:Flp pilus assembly protein TadG
VTRRRGRGQALVESAITVLLFAVLMFGILDFGRGFWTWQALTAAAREGTRWAIVHGNDSGTSMATASGEIGPYVRRNYGAGIPPGTNVSIAWPDGTNEPGSPVRVTVETRFAPSTPLLSKTGITLRGMSEMLIIR